MVTSFNKVNSNGNSDMVTSFNQTNTNGNWYDDFFQQGK